MVVELSGVSLQVGAVPILTDIDLVIAPGERIGVTGPNGAGKTTLLGVVATLLRPTAGTGRVLGVRLERTADLPSVRRRIGWSGHEPALYDELTLAENLEHVARLTGADRAAPAKALEQVGLAAAADRRAANCSNGMRRRADLARLLMLGPELALLDEAQAGLDEPAGVIVDEIVRRACAAGGAAVMVSHDAGLLGPQVDRIVRIEAGTVTR